MNKQINKMVTTSNVYVGMKVVRGRDWVWNNVDDNSVGVVTSEKWFSEVNDTYWCSVKWNNKDTYIYRIGDDAFDLYVYEEETNVKIKQNKQMKVSLTKNVKFPEDIVREITITVLIDGSKVRAGYSVRMDGDDFDKNRADVISTGRALKDKTNLVDMTVGAGMDKKYILYAIAEHLFKQLESGSLTIKGIK